MGCRREHPALGAGCLPEYARPLFVRLLDAIEVTATFKQRKQELVSEGYDPRATADAVYLDDRSAGAFVRVDAARHTRIEAGEIRF